jgi:hypothetical protein
MTPSILKFKKRATKFQTCFVLDGLTEIKYLQFQFHFPKYRFPLVLVIVKGSKMNVSVNVSSKRDIYIYI